MLEVYLPLQVHLHVLPAECRSEYSQWTHPSSVIMRSQFLRNHCTMSFTLNLSLNSAFLYTVEKKKKRKELESNKGP